MPQPKDKDWLNGYKNKAPTYVVTHVEKRRGHSKGWKERDKLRVAMTYMHYHVYKRELVGRCSTTEGAQTAVP